ncbi:hypothetical protein NDU88_004524 [Pleurodeles waltl]|uniref:Uncharacterized protein n=1 Tax=Pleurodeles waltl TaxID=8319 RepID=A0AAV7MBY5_PLEWA|nr:hypothetical protein NDU88_004524 [Pleurodeles waltl]
MARNSGDKMDGAKASRLGKDKRDPAGANRHPLSKMARQTERNTTGLGKGAKTDDNITSLIEVRGKSKSQPTITSFLAGGTQESGNMHTTPPFGDKEGPQAQQSGNSTRVEDASNISATLGAEAGQNTLLKPGGRDKEKETKTLDWAKDSGDKCYSLTEESDLSSVEHDLSESGSSIF